MRAELYTEFFGFSERPFTLLPDPDFLYWSASHKRAYSILQYGVMTRAPVTIVTGEIGAGKTTLIQQLLGSMDEDMTVGLVSNAQGRRDDLLRWVLHALCVQFSPNEDYVSLFNLFQDFVIEEYAAGRYVVLIIDEAQNLSFDALEELRMFTNMNSNKHELLQVILVGQPELRDMVADPSLVQFSQRITASFHLEALDQTATCRYIKHRLRHVGGTGQEFSIYAQKAVYRESRGVPRVINKYCDMALVYAAASERKAVGIDVVRELVEDGLFIQPLEEPEDILILRHPVNRVAE